MAKTLNIIESAYRATLEEQDDTIVWISTAMRGAGADLDVLLEGNAVNYAVKGQDASGLEIGTWKQTQPPKLDRDVGKLMEKGAKVFVVADDVAARGLEGSELIAGIETVSRSGIAKLMGGYERVWRW